MELSKEESKQHADLKPSRKKKQSPPCKARQPSLDVRPIEIFNTQFVMVARDEYQTLVGLKDQESRVCCLQEFVFGQDLAQPQSYLYEYKMFHYPFGLRNEETLKKTICSFLNYKGGFIFIGVKETFDKRRVVVGLYLSQAQKEHICSQIRIMLTDITPNVIVEQKVQTYFVPVKDKRVDGQFMMGRYVIKVRVTQGSPRRLYSVRTQLKTKYFIRYQSQCIVIRQGAVQVEKGRRQGLPQSIQLTHMCPDPPNGVPSYHSNSPCSNFYHPQDQEWGMKAQKLTLVKVINLPSLKSVSSLTRFLKRNSIDYSLQVLSNLKSQGVMIRLKLAREDRLIKDKVEGLKGNVISSEMAEKVRKPAVCREPKTVPLHPSTFSTFQGWVEGHQKQQSEKVNPMGKQGQEKSQEQEKGHHSVESQKSRNSRKFKSFLDSPTVQSRGKTPKPLPLQPSLHKQCGIN